MQALVTGGAGFIGSTLVDRLLTDGHTVDVVDNLSSGSLGNLQGAMRVADRFDFHRLDIREEELITLVERLAPSVIFHLAAQSSVAVSVASPHLDTDVNVLGTVRVLDAARAGKVKKVVFAASGGTLYGSPALDDLPVTETHPHRPSSPYGIAKRTAVDYLVAYRSLYGLDFTALALANVYGRRQDPFGEAGVAAIFASNIVAGTSSTIHGDGNQTRDFVHVNDVVDAFSRAASAGSGMVINIGSGIQTSVNALYSAMARVNGDAPPTTPAPGRDGDVRFSALCPDLAREVLGWTSATTLDLGIADVLAAARERLDRVLAST